MIIFYKVWVVVNDLGDGDGAEVEPPPAKQNLRLVTKHVRTYNNW